MSDALPGLDALRELPLPAAVSYWPQTWGWAVLAVVLGVAAHGPQRPFGAAADAISTAGRR